MNDLKIFLFNVVVILIGLVILFITSLFFELRFIQSHVSRQLVVWFVMLLEFFVMIRIIYLYNKIRI